MREIQASARKFVEIGPRRKTWRIDVSHGVSCGPVKRKRRKKARGFVKQGANNKSNSRAADNRAITANEILLSKVRFTFALRGTLFSASDSGIQYGGLLDKP